jgi:predicted RNA-binding Zn-ribbon protein involved in translation (DUF1610 family)
LEDELLVAIAVCLLPILGLGGLWLLAKRFVRLRCPECNAKALVRFQERAALPPLFATYGCRKCGTSCVKVFRW